MNFKNRKNDKTKSNNEKGQHSTKNNKLLADSMARKRITELQDRLDKLQMKYNKLQKENEELQEENNKLKKENVKVKEILVKKYADLQEMLHEIELCKPYIDFFDKNINSLQILLGLAEEDLDAMDPERKIYYMCDKIAESLMDSVKKVNGQVRAHRLVFPPTEKEFNREEAEEVKELDLTELFKYFLEDDIRVREGKISLQMRNAVQQLGRIIEELENRNFKEFIDKEDVHKLAEKVNIILTENQIYPMFAGDDRLSPDLKKRFSKKKQFSICYPGIFIKKGDAYEVLGSYIGMDDTE